MMYTAEEGFSFGQGYAYILSVSTVAGLIVGIVQYLYLHFFIGYANYTERTTAALLPYVRDIRRLGSAAYDLSCIAAGLLDGYWELDLHEWDVCAANLIVREAGGVVCDFRRNRGVSQAAGNEVLVGEMLKYIR